MVGMIRRYLLTDPTVKKYVSHGNMDAIFHEHKPAINIDNYIILKDKPLEVGHIEKYQLDVLIFGKDFSALLEVESAVRALLNDVRGEIRVIEGDRFIRDMTMLTGGGRQFDESKDRHISVQYFRITI